MAAEEPAEEPPEELAHAEVLELFQAALARLVQDPLLCDLPPQVTAEEIGSQVALEYGQAMTVRVCKADGETVRACGAGAGRASGNRGGAGSEPALPAPQPWWWCRTPRCWS